MVQNAMTLQEWLIVTPVHNMMAVTEHWIRVSKEWRAGKCRLGPGQGLEGEAGRSNRAPMMFYLEMRAVGWEGVSVWPGGGLGLSVLGEERIPIGLPPRTPEASGLS